MFLHLTKMKRLLLFFACMSVTSTFCFIFICASLSENLTCPKNSGESNNSTGERQAKISTNEDTLKSQNYTKPTNANISNVLNDTIVIPSCQDCVIGEEVCFKREHHETPKCVKVVNENDPTGCGGLCEIKTHYCQLLHKKSNVYQCLPHKHLLRCPNDTFSCGNMCIAPEKRCDGMIDCSNGSDERDCVCDLTTHFQCGNKTSCLEYSKRCDRKVDCWDKSDEISCQTMSKCPEDYLHCDDGPCYAKEKFCDGKYDCEDKSDEPEGCQ